MASETTTTSIILIGPTAARNPATPPENDLSPLISETQNLDISETLEPPQPPPPSSTKGPTKGLTENLSPTFLSSGNPCLDFFFHVVPDTPSDNLIGRLGLAWSHDPLTTLKLICNLRGVRGTGKSDKNGFYTAALWLHQNHPKTLASNSRAFADFGYFKDLPEILYRLLEGPEVRELAKESWRSRKGAKIISPDKATARALRKERELLKAKRALERYENDPDYRFLYDSFCDCFAENLKSDVENLKNGDLGKISLASKWCPSVDSSYDKCTLMCEGIAKRVFPRTSFEGHESLDEARYAYRARDRLRKEVLVPLHKALELPEIFMSSNQWQALPYKRVASLAMRNYKAIFTKRDRERFEGYLDDVRSGKAKIAAGALLPHEIVKSLTEPDGESVAELQWKRMVDDLSSKGKLANCIAVCDVSGSMRGTPMEVCVALGLLVSELSEEPWRGKVITFSESPEIHLVEGDSLQSKTEFVRTMDWGMNTDFQKVFDLILDSAIEAKLGEDQIVKRVFVFSDMEFDQAMRFEGRAKQSWETDFEVIRRKFRENGFERVPEMVFWNLRDSSSTPVVASQSGVAMVSGFSKNLLTLFLEGGGVVDSEQVMGLALSGEEYKKLVVYD